MKFLPKTAPFLGLAALAALGLTAAPAAAQSYTLTVFNPGLGNGGGNGVNDSGQVAGGAYTANSPTHAFLSGPNGGTLQNLGTLPGGKRSYGSAVNNAGQVAGTSFESNVSYHAFLSGPNGGPLQDLGTLPGDSSSQSSGVNGAGQVTGVSYGPLGPSGFTTSRAFLSGANGGTLKDLGTLAGDARSFGYGVNDAGQVAGESDNADGTASAFLSDAKGGALKSLGTLGGILRNSSASAVNNTGQVAGFSYNDDFSVIHAFLSGGNGGALQDLGSLGGILPNSFASGVNADGKVVGYCLSSDGSTDAAFLFSNGMMTDLNTLIAPGSGFYLDDAAGISDTGFITGYGSDANGNQFAYLLTPTNAPVPEASTTVSFGVLLAMGIGGVFVAAKRKRKA